jgi:hypothetical protein
MQAPENNASEHEEIMSPFEERHIDYILEEEFSIDPDFLTFFLGQARLSAIDKNRIGVFAAKCSCRAARSTTTEDGESDLLVKYSERERVLPIGPGGTPLWRGTSGSTELLVDPGPAPHSAGKLELLCHSITRVSPVVSWKNSRSGARLRLNLTVLQVL